jgi:hypothetical protein
LSFPYFTRKQIIRWRHFTDNKSCQIIESILKYKNGFKNNLMSVSAHIIQGSISQKVVSLRSHLASCYRFSCYYRFSDIAINIHMTIGIFKSKFGKDKAFEFNISYDLYISYPWPCNNFIVTRKLTSCCNIEILYKIWSFHFKMGTFTHLKGT